MLQSQELSGSRISVKKYLSMLKVATEVTPVDDIRVVVEQADTKDEVTVQNVTIIGVPHLDIYKACVQCKAQLSSILLTCAKFRVWMTIVESGWNVWCGMYGVASGCGEQETGVASGSG